MVDITLRPRSIVVSSSTDFIHTTKFQWTDFEPYTLSTRGEQNIPEQYLKNAKWGYSPYTGTEGYHANSQYDEETYFPVEFNFDHLCWVEIHWNRQEEHWEAFHLAGADLGVDIPLSETRAGKYRDSPNPVDIPPSLPSQT